MNNTERIKQLVQIVEQSDIVGLSVEDGDFKIEIKKSGGQVTPAVFPSVISAAVPVAAPVAQTKAPETNLTAIKAPMTGTFYTASSPGAAPFVSVGSVVRKGQTVCIIEAMKTFNEIEADADGTIAEVLVPSGQPIELGQPLFLLK